MLPPLIRKQGYYYCERCINDGALTEGVQLFKRKSFKHWPKHIKWIPLCCPHGVGFEKFKEVNQPY